MKIQELYRSGVTDNEDLGDHERTAASIDFVVSFAHEQGYGEAFSQLFANDQFKASLEAKFGAVLHRLLQDAVAQSTIPRGTGWTDDFEVEASISTNSNKPM